jgi:glucose/arabinose dehydrogenase
MPQFYFSNRKLLFVILLAATSFGGTMAQPTVIFRQVMGGFNSPVDVVSAGDGSHRLFVVEKRGVIRVIKSDGMVQEPFLNITNFVVSNGERGLLSLAFHPDFENNRTFFIYFNNLAGELSVARLQTLANNPDMADINSARILLAIPKPTAIHNGADLNFGADGYLYFATGDGGPGGNPSNSAQDGTNLLGKMLRINVNLSDVAPYYTIPPDNPYVGMPGILPEIFQAGLRNPFRWNFDRLTNDMWIGDVGENLWEELNYVAAGTGAGKNFGWRCYEGSHVFNTTGCMPVTNYTAPIFEYAHDTAGGFSITGGAIFRDPLFPQLNGWYLMSDWVTGHLWKVKPDGAGGWTVTRQPKALTNITSYGYADDDAVYVVTLSGLLFRVEAAVESPLPLTLADFRGEQVTNGNNLSWQTSFEQNLKQFEVEYSEDNAAFTSAGIVAARNVQNGAGYSFTHNINNTKRIYYRLKMVDLDGRFEYSNTITLDVTTPLKNYVSPTIIVNGNVSVFLVESFDRVELIDLQGKILRKQSIGGRMGRIDVQLPAAAKGTVIVRVVNADPKKSFNTKVLVR